jgi:hypothetical protein
MPHLRERTHPDMYSQVQKYFCNLFQTPPEYTDAWMNGREMFNADEPESVHFAVNKSCLRQPWLDAGSTLSTK